MLTYRLSIEAGNGSLDTKVTNNSRCRVSASMRKHSDLERPDRVALTSRLIHRRLPPFLLQLGRNFDLLPEPLDHMQIEAVLGCSKWHKVLRVLRMPE